MRLEYKHGALWHDEEGAEGCFIPLVDFKPSGRVGVPLSDEVDRIGPEMARRWNVHEDLEHAKADTDRLVKELDVIINGPRAAETPSLVDIVAQIRGQPMDGAKVASEQYKHSLEVVKISPGEQSYYVAGKRYVAFEGRPYHLPERYNYLAMDKDGTIKAFIARPVADFFTNCWLIPDSTALSADDIDLDTMTLYKGLGEVFNWKETLEELNP